MLSIRAIKISLPIPHFQEQAMPTQYVYSFRAGATEAAPGGGALLGNKGAGLAEMTRVGLPVPPGFTITTEACRAYYKENNNLPDGLWEQVLAAVAKLEAATGKKLGDAANPLLVSVRSGAPVSMPGMLDTVLNLGLEPATVEGLGKLSGSGRFAWDAYRRFIQMFSRIVMGIPAEPFEKLIAARKLSVGARLDTDLTAADWQSLCDEFKALAKQHSSQPFPDHPLDQLNLAIRAVFASWHGRRAVDYRRVNNIPDDLGTAVSVVAMVFGNLGGDSGTGVTFTRNPVTGAHELYGEYLQNAQGEDVVAGIRTPRKIAQLHEEMPAVYDQLVETARLLERHYTDMQDIEFTVEKGKLWILQTRAGKRTGAAALRIAVDMVHEKLIDEKTAVRRVQPGHLDQLLHPTLDPDAAVDLLATGLAASPGAATGSVVFDPDEAKALAEAGEKVILVRVETSPDDFHGMVAAQAILTARGGLTSHAAVVARGMGKCCVTGCDALHIDYYTNEFIAGGRTVHKGDIITVDGSTGRVLLGAVPLIQPQPDAAFGEFMGWADRFRTLQVLANADTPHDAAVARQYGAQGIGLCRTEHMFFEAGRIEAMQAMILADTPEARLRELEKLEPLQHADFLGLFTAMDGFPVTIRTLDPPLHEFLPHSKAEIAVLAKRLKVSAKALDWKIGALREANPMLGHRGCRLGLMFPEITQMQARAIFTAAAEAQRNGIKVFPEVMIPLVSDVNELALQAATVRKIADEVFAAALTRVAYKIGTMIELPRAALTADAIAREADFFSFGTNDLTQTTYGLSRDDAGRFLPHYVENKIYPSDPFQKLDQTGVGKLMEIAVKLGRQTKPNLKIGICGEHGGEPSSIEFCHKLGVNYVSCSPYRVPIARLAAAHAALEAEK
jgi:pyruvate,orthophosphate dikinase